MKSNLELLIDIYRNEALYFRMPKVASASISRSLGRDVTVLSHGYRPNTVRLLLKLNSKSFKFTFVRHPYDRFLSAYKWATRELIYPGRHPLDGPQREAVLSFDSMDDFCMNLPYLFQDKTLHLLHFYPQTSYICQNNRLLIDFVGRYEFLEEDFKKIWEHHKIQIDVTFGANKKNLNKREIAPIENSLSPETRKILDLVYEKDFDILEYGTY